MEAGTDAEPSTTNRNIKSRLLDLPVITLKCEELLIRWPTEGICDNTALHCKFSIHFATCKEWLFFICYLIKTFE